MRRPRLARERRQAVEAARGEEVKERLIARLEEMGQRFLTVRVPGRTLEDDLELAKQLARARNREQIDELCISADLSRMEAVAIAMTVDPKAAMRMLGEYSRRRHDPD